MVFVVSCCEVYTTAKCNDSMIKFHTTLCTTCELDVKLKCNYFMDKKKAAIVRKDSSIRVFYLKLG